MFLSPELLSLSQQVGNDTEGKGFACNSAVKALFSSSKQPPWGGKKLNHVLRTGTYFKNRPFWLLAETQHYFTGCLYYQHRCLPHLLHFWETWLLHVQQLFCFLALSWGSRRKHSKEVQSWPHCYPLGHYCCLSINLSKIWVRMSTFSCSSVRCKGRCKQMGL